MAPPSCHPDLPNAGHDMCKSCYDKDYRTRNRSRVKAQKQDYYRRRVAADPEGARAEYRAASLKRTHGMTVGEYEAILGRQDGRCAICAALPGRIRLAVDHNHTTGVRRELLCRRCNVTLGQMDDNPDILVAAAAYLRKHS